MSVDAVLEGEPASSTLSYRLTLYVNGASELSSRAIRQAAELCEAYIGGRHHLTVVDLGSDADLGPTTGIIASPTLVRTEPLPVRSFVGSLADGMKVSRALDLPGTGDGGPARDV